MHPWLRLPLPLALLLVTACNNSVVVELQTGAQTFDLNAESLEIPAALRDGDTVTSIDCSATGICPSTAEVTVDCAANVCNPAPISVAVQVGDVVDFGAILDEAGTLVRIVDEVEIARAEFAVSPNGLTVPLPAVEILWAPETAVSADEATLLGTIPTIPAMTALDGEMTIDGNGEVTLSNFILTGSARARFFARTTVDLEPGGAFPAGAATATVNIRIRAIGRIID